MNTLELDALQSIVNALDKSADAIDSQCLHRPCVLDEMFEENARARACVTEIRRQEDAGLEGVTYHHEDCPGDCGRPGGCVAGPIEDFDERMDALMEKQKKEG